VLILITPPAEEPVSLEAAKLHLRNPPDLEDDLVAELIVAARRMCEGWLRRTFITSTWELTLDGFPGCRYYGDDLRSLERDAVGTRYGIQLPNPPLISVTSIKYVAGDGTTQTVDPSRYQVETGTPGRVVPIAGSSWPTTRRQPGAVTIRFVAGYGDAADVPASIKIAMKLYLTSLYENRGEDDVPLPRAAERVMTAEDWGFYA